MGEWTNPDIIRMSNKFTLKSYRTNILDGSTPMFIENYRC